MRLNMKERAEQLSNRYGVAISAGRLRAFYKRSGVKL